MAGHRHAAVEARLARRPLPDVAAVRICPSPLRNLSLVSRVVNSQRRHPREAGEASSHQIVVRIASVSLLRD